MSVLWQNTRFQSLSIALLQTVCTITPTTIFISQKPNTRKCKCPSKLVLYKNTHKLNTNTGVCVAVSHLFLHRSACNWKKIINQLNQCMGQKLLQSSTKVLEIEGSSESFDTMTKKLRPKLYHYQCPHDWNKTMSYFGCRTLEIKRRNINAKNRRESLFSCFRHAVFRYPPIESLLMKRLITV